MGLLSKMRRQAAIYWPPATAGDFGQPTVGTLVELKLTDEGANYRVRWEEKAEEYTDADNTTHVSRAVVYVPQLPDSTEVQRGGWLWLGVRAGLTDEAVPANNAGASQVRHFAKVPDMKATKYLRTAYL